MYVYNKNDSDTYYLKQINMYSVITYQLPTVKRTIQVRRHSKFTNNKCSYSNQCLVIYREEGLNAKT